MFVVIARFGGIYYKLFIREEIMETFKHLKIGKAPGASEVNAELIVASGDIGIRVLMELCQRILDGKRMPADWATSVTIPILREKDVS